MVLIKILKRRDAASVVIAVVLAFLLIQLLSSLTMRTAALLAGLDTNIFGGNGGPGGGWRAEYLQPVVSFFLSILLLEAFAWLYIGINHVVSGRLPVRSKRR